MNSFKTVDPEAFEQSPFKLIGKDWMLVTAEKDGKANTMTASWGGFGVMWGKNVAYIVLRPQRYTKELIDQADTFSLSFLDAGFRDTLSYLGTKSGRDEDKIAKSNLTLVHADEVPCFSEAKTVILCRKMYAQAYKPECFIEQGAETQWYPNKDYHTLYIAEITKILVKE